jgi:hypothetical protein
VATHSNQKVIKGYFNFLFFFMNFYSEVAKLTREKSYIARRKSVLRKQNTSRKASGGKSVAGKSGLSRRYSSRKQKRGTELERNAKLQSMARKKLWFCE